MLGRTVTVWNNNWHFIRGCLLAFVIVMAMPAITEYWLRHVPIPEVPVSTIVLLVVASLFLLTFTASMVVVLYFLKRIAETERTVHHARKRVREPRATDGTFIPVTDEDAWREEELADLKRAGVATDQVDLLRDRGILTQADKEALEEMAMAAALRSRGRTE